ncbi:hypothetical protein JIG36_38615 [Actinoplanes sp. LDG1-06]|uniref:Uncharacterized protein n=1 Tax=Paractinoplanes ovalisporus TaxID=2810368 RepID=A0ABS2ANJ3_9ACTN|nr:hypothetical protein [Actinoplanes ovalisporus]MBM2621433.1 hypothetical protein [Actinoplanes ovalisporus]
MPGQRFTVQLDDAALPRPAGLDDGKRPDRKSAGAKHHGAGDDKQAARQRSERAHAGRATGTGGGRSYAFRRS